MENIKVRLMNEIEKQDWEYVLSVMKKNNRKFGFVDFDSNGKMEFYDSDPYIDGVHSMPITLKNIEEIINYYK